MIRKAFEKTLVRYLFVGGVSFLIEIGTLYFLNSIIGLSALWSVAISFWVGFIVAYVLQKIVTFRNRDYSKRTIAKQLVGYSLLVAWNYGFTLLAVSVFESTISVIVIRTIVIIITTVWNFLIYRKLFAQKGDE